MSKGFRNSASGKVTALQMANTPVSHDTHVSTAVLRQRAGAEVAEPVSFLIIGKAPVTPTAHTLIGCNPHAPVSALQKRANEIVDQTILDHIVGQVRTA